MATRLSLSTCNNVGIDLDCISPPSAEVEPRGLETPDFALALSSPPVGQAGSLDLSVSANANDIPSSGDIDDPAVLQHELQKRDARIAELSAKLHDMTAAYASLHCEMHGKEATIDALKRELRAGSGCGSMGSMIAEPSQHRRPATGAQDGVVQNPAVGSRWQLVSLGSPDMASPDHDDRACKPDRHIPHIVLELYQSRNSSCHTDGGDIHIRQAIQQDPPRTKGRSSMVCESPARVFPRSGARHESAAAVVESPTVVDKSKIKSSWSTTRQRHATMGRPSSPPPRASQSSPTRPRPSCAATSCKGPVLANRRLVYAKQAAQAR